MSQHFDLSRSHLAAAAEVRERLDQAYTRHPKRPHEIAALNDHLRHNMAVARMHAELAQVQAIYDLRASVDQLFQALAEEPEPAWAVARPALELVNTETEGGES